MKPYSQQGFSLVELMIVITIIGILAVIAAPSYQNYPKRARFAEVIAATSPFKIAIAIALQQGDALTDLNLGEHGVPPSPDATKNLAHIKVNKGVITATGTKAAGGATYILKPNVDGSAWTIEGTCVSAGLCSS